MYLEVENLFKNKNIYDVYAKTGNPYDDGTDLEDDQINYTYPEVAYAYGLAVRNPTYVNNLRAVTLGVSFNF
jgi:hypothetical protein